MIYSAQVFVIDDAFFFAPQDQVFPRAPEHVGDALVVAETPSDIYLAAASAWCKTEGINRHIRLVEMKAPKEIIESMTTPHLLLEHGGQMTCITSSGENRAESEYVFIFYNQVQFWLIRLCCNVCEQV